MIGTQPRQGGHRTRRTTAVATGALVLVAAGGAAAWAATAAPTPSPSSTPSGAAPARPGEGVSPTPGAGAAPGAGGRRAPGRGGLVPGGALHGELTVPDGSGYRQVLVQRGDVTAVSPTSLAVTSADGYAKTYVLDGDTVVDGVAGDVSSLAVGDTVSVLADADGTATRVHEDGQHARKPERTAPTPAPGETAPDGTAGPRDGRLPHGGGMLHRRPAPGTSPDTQQGEGSAASPSAGPEGAAT